MPFKTILLAGAMLLQALNLCAQIQIPGNKLSHLWLAERAPDVLAKLQQLQLDVRASTSTIEARGNAPVLDSAILYTGYAWGDSFPQYKAEYSYPLANLTTQTEYNYLGGWQVERQITVKTDNLGRQLELLGYVFDPITQVWVPESRLRNYPHGTSATDIDSLLVEVWDTQTGAWSTIFYSETSYDQNDRPVLVAYYFNNLGFTIALLDELYYDDNGDNYLTDQSVFEQSQWTVFSRVEREFVQHREVRSTTYAVPEPPDAPFPTDKTETSYDAAGNAVLVEAFDADFFTGEWTLRERTERSFDNVKRLTSETYEDFGPDAPPANRTNYVYQNTDGEDYKVEIYSEFDASEQEWVVLEKTWYYYSNTTAAPSVQNGTQLRLYPNPTTGSVQLPVSNGDSQIQVLNAQGQAVRITPNMISQNLLDLSGLPAGLYYITVQQGQLRQTGTVVKQ